MLAMQMLSDKSAIPSQDALKIRDTEDVVSKFPTATKAMSSYTREEELANVRESRICNKVTKNIHDLDLLAPIVYQFAQLFFERHSLFLGSQGLALWGCLAFY